MAEAKVILTKSVNHLGHPGDVVTVKAGYARNYLIPQGLGFAWSKNAAAQIEAMKRARLAKAVATREEAVAAKELIEVPSSKSPPRSPSPASCSVASPPTRSPSRCLPSCRQPEEHHRGSDQDHRRVRCDRRSAPGNLRFLHREGCR